MSASKNERRSNRSITIGYLLAWLVPGAGYWYTGYKARAVLLFVTVVGLFTGGLAMKGGIFSASQDFVSLLCEIARTGVGIPWLVTLFSDIKTTDMLSPLGEIGACYTTVAGLLNFLVVIKTGDLLRK